MNMYKKILSFLIKKTIIYIDILIHRKRIRNFLINTNLKINTIFDVGSNNGDYSLLFNHAYLRIINYDLKVRRAFSVW